MGRLDTTASCAYDAPARLAPPASRTRCIPNTPQAAAEGNLAQLPDALEQMEKEEDVKDDVNLPVAEPGSVLDVLRKTKEVMEATERDFKERNAKNGGKSELFKSLADLLPRTYLMQVRKGAAPTTR